MFTSVGDGMGGEVDKPDPTWWQFEKSSIKKGE